MKALILNSGMGSRLDEFTSNHPKCMTSLDNGETILSRQLRQLKGNGINEVVITTGYLSDMLEQYCHGLNLGLNISFVHNPIYENTNYIYSIYLARDLLQDDIVLLHGDLVFDDIVLDKAIQSRNSVMAVDTHQTLPEKDFKAVVDTGVIRRIGIEFFDNAVSAQPLYKLNKAVWYLWLGKISEYCESGNRKCYAENAYNDIADETAAASSGGVYPLDIAGQFCREIDTLEDYNSFRKQFSALTEHQVYMCISTDILHAGHINMINKAASLGRLIVGVLSDKAVASYKRFPLLSFEERKTILSNIKGIDEVVCQDSLSYVENIRKYKPDIVVHGDDWREGLQKPVRAEVVQELQKYGGRLIEYPYSESTEYKLLERSAIEQLSIPDRRRGRLRQLIDMKTTINAIEAHSGITGLIAEKTTVYNDGVARSFDAMWVSSLCDSTAKGKPDIELVDMSSRFRTLDDIMEVTTKPIILDGDTGGLTEHFVYTVRTLERMGVSAVIIEDKTGLKKNSLFGTEVNQTQDSIENFSAKIRAGKAAQRTKEFMIIARIESLILEKGMDDALERAFAFVNAGADGIMIHSRKKDPTEIFEFCEKFREKDGTTPIVVVPTSFNAVTEEEFYKRNINIVIYANQLTRSGFPAMKKAAELILENGRAKEADDICMSIKEILTLIPEE